MLVVALELQLREQVVNHSLRRRAWVQAGGWMRCLGSRPGESGSASSSVARWGAAGAGADLSSRRIANTLRTRSVAHRIDR